ncbi:MAG: hypothetical protein V4465_02420 [Patescibacteria group bacterium]
MKKALYSILAVMFILIIAAALNMFVTEKRAVAPVTAPFQTR